MDTVYTLKPLMCPHVTLRGVYYSILDLLKQYNIVGWLAKDKFPWAVIQDYYIVIDTGLLILPLTTRDPETCVNFKSSIVLYRGDTTGLACLVLAGPFF